MASIAAPILARSFVVLKPRRPLKRSAAGSDPEHRMIRAWLILGIALAAASCEAAPVTFQAIDPHSPLRLETVIALPNVKGRIDHLAFDPKHRHLFVAEHDNGSVDEIDL